MKVLFLTNIVVPQMSGFVNFKTIETGGWLHSVVAGLLERDSIDLAICVPTSNVDSLVEEARGRLTLFAVPEKNKFAFDSSLEAHFGQVLDSFQPDIVNIFGTEYPRTLSMVNATGGKKTAITITGLVTVYASRFMGSMPRKYSGLTWRRFLEPFTGIQTLRSEQKGFYQRSPHEIEALKKVAHVIGRTRFDRSFVASVNDSARYHFCNESLRPGFYDKHWRLEDCERYSIIVPQAGYPIKGFEVLLEALKLLKGKYPSIRVVVPGASCLSGPESLRKRVVVGLSEYPSYISSKLKQYDLMENVEFVGPLDEEGLSNVMLRSNMFVLPSAIENSPNTLGEAMLMGLPCVASCVGGVQDLMSDGVEGFLYPYNEPVTLAYLISRIFDDEKLATDLGERARIRAKQTHCVANNIEALVRIYEEIYAEEAALEVD